MSLFDFFVSCPSGLESVLSEELNEIAAGLSPHAPGASAPKAASSFSRLKIGQTVSGGVHCKGRWEAAMQLNLHSRIASRVLLKLDERPYQNEEDIFDFALAQEWEAWFTPQHTLRVHMSAIRSPLRSLDFATLRVKDAVCDRFREKTGQRPSVNTYEPDVRIFVFLSDTICTLYLDTSGDSLFKRGWRLDKGAAPLRENLAAGIIRLSGWKPGTALYDPMCGSGTFLAEAAQMALNLAPGAHRSFGFENLAPFDGSAWRSIKIPAQEAYRNVINRPGRELGESLGISGSDISTEMLAITRANLSRAGLPALPLTALDARKITPPSTTPGIIVMNPPYGERIEVRGERAPHSERGRREDRFRPQEQSPHYRTRLSEPAALENAQAPDDFEFFKELGDALKQRFTGWRACILTPDRRLPGKLRLREALKTPLFNGPLECRLFRFDLIAGSMRRKND